MIDLTPATERMAQLLDAIHDDQFDAATPCPDARLGDLIDHVGSLTTAFTAAARKDRTGRAGPPPTPHAANLEADWRARIARDLVALADAWRDPSAWDGLTTVGGLDLPGEVAGLIALDELVVHGWDIAVASSQRYEPAPQDVEASIGAVRSFDAPRDGSLFGPVVPVPDTADPFDQLLGLTGRDPAWQPTR